MEALSTRPFMTPDEERRSIETQITFHKGAIGRLHLRLNSLSGTACLPTELLYEIFRHYVVTCREDDEPFALLPIVHTCRHWRNVAINLPSLWSHIVVTPCKDWVKAMLTYSKKCPLTIQAKAYKIYKRVVASLKLVLTQMYRIARLRLALPPAAFDSMRRQLSSAAPMLRSIDLDVTVNTFRDVSNLPFGSNLSALQEIYTTLPLSAIRSVAQPTVRSLYLDLLNLSWSHQSSIPNDLLSILSNMRQLERIFIQTRFCDLPNRNREVSLPRLKILEIHAHEKFHEWVLGSIQFPPTTLLRLYCRVSSFGFPRSPFVIAFASHWAEYTQPMGQSPELFDLATSARETDMEHQSRDINHWAVPSTTSDDLPTVEVAISSNAVDVNNLCARLTLPVVQVLWLDLVNPLPQIASVNPFGVLTKALREMKGLKTLILEGWSETSIATALETSVDCMRQLGSGSQRPNDVLFPVLETLVLRKAKFGPLAGQGPDGFYRALRYGLQDRRQLHAPIERLIIEKADGLSEDDVKKLELWVLGTDVLWDGIESDFSFMSDLSFDLVFA